MRLDRTIRCFQTFQALHRKQGVTAIELRDILECSLKTAYRYLDSASCVLLIYSEGWPQRFKLNDPIGNFDRLESNKTKSHNLRIGRGVADGIKTR